MRSTQASKPRPWRWWVAGLVVAAGSSCSRPLPEAAYRAYVQDAAHGLVQVSVSAAGDSLRCAYRPAELLVAQELRAAALPATPAVLDSVRGQFAGKTYCTLTLAHRGAEIENQFIQHPTAYTQALAYLSTGIAQDVFLAPLASPRDSVAALAASYPRLYGGTGRSTVLLVFDTGRLALGEGFRLTFRDSRLGLGTHHFTFSAAALQRVPALQF